MKVKMPERRVKAQEWKVIVKETTASENKRDKNERDANEKRTKEGKSIREIKLVKVVINEDENR